MGLQELLSQIRQFYLDHFREILREKRRLPMARIIAEPALRGPDGKVARQGNLKLPIRTDLVIRSSTVNDSVSVAKEKPLDFDPVLVEWTPTLKVFLAPFRWEECRVLAGGLGNRTDWHPLNDWYERWFDEFDLKAPLKKDLQEVVHRLADPQVKEGSILLTVDLGTAPIAALEELLDSLANMGANSLQVGEEQNVEKEASARSLEVRPLGVSRMDGPAAHAATGEVIR
jgi:hypothetical protein